MIGAIFGIGLNLLLVAGIVLGVRALLRRRNPVAPGAAVQGATVRQFFQYVLLFGLVTIVAVGLAGLVGRALDAGNTLVSSDRAALARNVTFLVVGVPLLALLIQWTRRRFGADPHERASTAWVLYVSAMSLTALITTMVSAHEFLSWTVGMDPFRGTALAQAIVWGAIWGAHWRIGHVTVPTTSLRLHHVAGSVVGLAVALFGLIDLTGSALELLMPESDTPALITSDRPILSGVVTVLISAPVWWMYWVRTLAPSQRDTAWLSYLLLGGLSAPLIITITAISTAAYDALVWWIGDPIRQDATTHFGDTPELLAAAGVGVLAWWYHRAVLASGEPRERTEARRVYEYLMAAIALGAAAIGIATLLVAVLESFSGATAIAGRSAINTLLAAVTLLAVGAPVWWVYWSTVQRAHEQNADDEATAPTRRIYLFILFGIGGIAAVVSLLVGVFFLLEDLLEGNLALGTLRRMRIPLGVLLTTAAVAGYHWVVYRDDRNYLDKRHTGPRFVLLIGPWDAALPAAVEKVTGGQATLWPRPDSTDGAWDVDGVLRLVRSSTDREVVVLAVDGHTRLVPVNTRRS